mmetsp:Transcript_43844/g.124177  ORF Transcript_43844/g.124177 Transcript_43844/m.124177 type:complete len:257 (-) Transcript_43844:695-1465(-)
MPSLMRWRRSPSSRHRPSGLASSSAHSSSEIRMSRGSAMSSGCSGGGWRCGRRGRWRSSCARRSDWTSSSPPLSLSWTTRRSIASSTSSCSRARSGRPSASSPRGAAGGSSTHLLRPRSVPRGSRCTMSFARSTHRSSSRTRKPSFPVTTSLPSLTWTSRTRPWSERHGASVGALDRPVAMRTSGRPSSSDTVPRAAASAQLWPRSSLPWPTPSSHGTTSRPCERAASSLSTNALASAPLASGRCSLAWLASAWPW